MTDENVFYKCGRDKYLNGRFVLKFTAFNIYLNIIITIGFLQCYVLNTIHDLEAKICFIIFQTIKLLFNGHLLLNLPLYDCQLSYLHRINSIKSRFIFFEFLCNIITNQFNPYLRVEATVLLIIPQFSVSVFLAYVPNSLKQYIQNTLLLTVCFITQIYQFTYNFKFALSGLSVIGFLTVYYYLYTFEEQAIIQNENLSILEGNLQQWHTQHIKYDQQLFQKNQLSGICVCFSMSNSSAKNVQNTVLLTKIIDYLCQDNISIVPISLQMKEVTIFLEQQQKKGEHDLFQLVIFNVAKIKYIANLLNIEVGVGISMGDVNCQQFQYSLLLQREWLGQCIHNAFCIATSSINQIRVDIRSFQKRELKKQHKSIYTNSASLSQPPKFYFDQMKTINVKDLILNYCTVVLAKDIFNVLTQQIIQTSQQIDIKQIDFGERFKQSILCLSNNSSLDNVSRFHDENSQKQQINFENAFDYDEQFMDSLSQSINQLSNQSSSNTQQAYIRQPNKQQFDQIQENSAHNSMIASNQTDLIELSFKSFFKTLCKVFLLSEKCEALINQQKEYIMSKYYVLSHTLMATSGLYILVYIRYFVEQRQSLDIQISFYGFLFTYNEFYMLSVYIVFLLLLIQTICIIPYVIYQYIKYKNKNKNLDDQTVQSLQVLDQICQTILFITSFLYIILCNEIFNNGVQILKQYQNFIFRRNQTGFLFLTVNFIAHNQNMILNSAIINPIYISRNYKIFSMLLVVQFYKIARSSMCIAVFLLILQLSQFPFLTTLFITQINNLGKKIKIKEQIDKQILTLKYFRQSWSIRCELLQYTESHQMIEGSITKNKKVQYIQIPNLNDIIKRNNSLSSQEAIYVSMLYNFLYGENNQLKQIKLCPNIYLPNVILIRFAIPPLNKQEVINYIISTCQNLPNLNNVCIQSKYIDLVTYYDTAADQYLLQHTKLVLHSLFKINKRYSNINIYMSIGDIQGTSFGLNNIQFDVYGKAKEEIDDLYNNADFNNSIIITGKTYNCIFDLIFKKQIEEKITGVVEEDFNFDKRFIHNGKIVLLTESYDK